MINSPFFLSETLVHALGWTLVHSLWQGAVIALALWLLLPRLRAARQRYWVSYAALLSVLMVGLATFGLEYSGHAIAQPVTAVWEEAPGAGLAELTPAPALAPDTWASLAGRLEPYHPFIVGVWLLGFLFFLLRLAGGLHYVQRLRRRHNIPAPAVWQEKLQGLSVRIGIRRPVALLESALIGVPVALGFFKPLILLPLGMVNQLRPAEVEAILAHELAHIARRDWLFNLLQTLVESVFYFHPAVWWMAATIRAERENCCDDTAVALTGDRLCYAKTLVRLQDLSRASASPSPILALSLEGSTNLLRRRPLLLERIKRILHQPQPSSLLMEKTIALGIFVALFTLWTLRANTPPALTESIREIAEAKLAWFGAEPEGSPAALQTAGDTLPKPKQRQRIVREDDDQRVELDLDNGKITRLVIDGKEIAPEAYDQYSSLTESMLSEAALPPPPPTPAPGMEWEVAPAPPAPPGAWDLRTPAPPPPPRAPSSRLSTDKDDEGNTIIRLERNGKPVEIRVKDGEVWVDGKKVEEGETLDLPGGENQPLLWNDGNRMFRLDGNRLRFNSEDGAVIEIPAPADAPHFFRFDTEDGKHFEFNQDHNQFHFESPEGFHFKSLDDIDIEIPDLSITREELQRIQEKTMRNLEIQQKEMEQQLREMEKELRNGRKEGTVEQKERRKALEEARRSLEESRKIQGEELARIHRDQARAKEDFRRAQADQRIVIRERNRTESISSVLKNALLRDKLISDPDNFSLELSGKDMKVNGKKQAANIHRRYLDLYLDKTGKELGKKDNFRIEVEN